MTRNRLCKFASLNREDVVQETRIFKSSITKKLTSLHLKAQDLESEYKEHIP